MSAQAELQEARRERLATVLAVLVPNRGGKLHIKEHVGCWTVCGRQLNVDNETYRHGSRTVAELNSDIDTCRDCRRQL